MKFITLYGPPAVGKLTVAKALVEQTGYKLFHNHLTNDVASAIFDRGTPPYYQLLQSLRLVTLEEASRANIAGLVTTGVYRPQYLPALIEYEDIINKYDGEALYVRLYAGVDTLAKRVISEDRQDYGKLHTVEGLHEILDTMDDPFVEIAGRESLSIDTTHQSPAMVAQTIIDHYQL